MVYYNCFSINLLRFIKANGVRPLRKETHSNGRNFWVFEVDGKLSGILTTWAKTSKE